MTQRTRKKSSNYREAPNGGNVLFTLGLVSVVALLIVGWIMTKGGVGPLTDKGLELAKISLSTPTPEPLPTRINQSTQSSGAAISEIIKKYDKEMKQLRDSHKKELGQLRLNYEAKLNDLKLQIQLLQTSNKKLREKNQ
jgi:hypothetical protein